MSDFPMPPKTYLNESSFALHGERIGDNKSPPAMLFRVARNRPKIVIYLNDSNWTKDHGTIALEFKPIEWNTLLEMILLVANKGTDTSIRLDNVDFKWMGRERSEEKVVVGSVIVGRTPAGVVYIGVDVGGGSPKPKFLFSKSADAKYIDVNTKEPLDQAMLSELRAKAFVRMVNPIIQMFLVSSYKAPKPREQKDNKYSPNNKQNSESDDDIPY